MTVHAFVPFFWNMTQKNDWKYDTHFLRSTEIDNPKYAVTSEYLRVYNDSRLLYSRRMVMESYCSMNFQNYPMDTQVTYS